jgi:tetratricopeptide (TPR) repeat protein
MELRGRAFALYGRFSPGVRDQLQKAITAGGGFVARDLTRRSQVLVIGALASSLIESGALGARIASARERGLQVVAERAFRDDLAGNDEGEAPTLPLATALTKTSLVRADVDLLAAFDLVTVAEDRCRFGDRARLRTAGEILDRGRPRADVVRILTRARDLAPRGRHKIVLTPTGEAALQWDHGLTSLEGQGLLAFDDGHPTIDDLFEQASTAEAAGDLGEAARLYDQCARADRTDPIAPYNYANIQLSKGDHSHAVLGYQRALARDPGFAEARYNLAQALEALGKTSEAALELHRVLEVDPANTDALFNLAQLQMRAGELKKASQLYDRYLAMEPPEEWAAIARKAVAYCSAQLALS